MRMCAHGPSPRAPTLVPTWSHVCACVRMAPVRGPWPWFPGHMFAHVCTWPQSVGPDPGSHMVTCMRMRFKHLGSDQFLGARMKVCSVALGRDSRRTLHSDRK